MKKYFLSLLFFLTALNMLAFKKTWFLADTEEWEGFNNVFTMENLYGPEPPVYTHEGVTVMFTPNENVGELRSSIDHHPELGVYLYWTQDTMHITPPEGNAITKVEFICMMENAFDYYAVASEGTEDLAAHDTTDYVMRWDGCCTTSLTIIPNPRVIFNTMLVTIDEIENIQDGLLGAEEDVSGIITIEESSPVEYFNLKGEKISKNNLSRGIYIVNGRKVLISN